MIGSCATLHTDPTWTYLRLGQFRPTRDPSQLCGCLVSYRLNFTRYSMKRGGGVADIVEDDDRVVWGVLYDVPDEELNVLDYKEDVKKRYYQRMMIEVLDSSGNRIPPLTYLVVNQQDTLTLPNPTWTCCCEAQGTGVCRKNTSSP